MISTETSNGSSSDPYIDQGCFRMLQPYVQKLGQLFLMEHLNEPQVMLPGDKTLVSAVGVRTPLHRKGVFITSTFPSSNLWQTQFDGAR